MCMYVCSLFRTKFHMNNLLVIAIKLNLVKLVRMAVIMLFQIL